MTKIKICGLKRPEDIKMINEFQPDYAGFVINFPKSHRSVSPEEVRKLAAELDRGKIKAVGVFVDEPVENVAELINDGTLDLAQLHGNESEVYINELRTLTGKDENYIGELKSQIQNKRDFIIKAFKVESLESLKKAAKSSADFILLDQGKGSGETFDWSILLDNEAREIFEKNEIPKDRWFLAGGINENNLKTAIEKFHPFAIDLSSAAETDGVKDREKVRRIIQIFK